MTKEESIKLVQLMFALWPHYELNATVFEAGFIALERFEYKDAYEAVKSCLQEPERRFPPTVGEVLGVLRAAAKKRNSVIKQPETPCSTLSRTERQMFAQKLLSKRGLN